MALLLIVFLILAIYIFTKKTAPKDRKRNALLLFVFFLIGISFFIPKSDNSPKNNIETTNEQISDNVELAKVSNNTRDEVVAYFKSGKEPKVKDTVWSQDGIFKVGMINDNSDRSGFAEYVCTILYDFGFKGHKIWVQIIDIEKLVNTNKWEKLGEARCL